MTRRGRLERGVSVLGLDLDASQIDRLVRYLAEIDLWNPKYGLVRAEGEELDVKHLLDSLAGAARIGELIPSAGSRISDVGSGAGFPGVPLAIVFPDHEFTLIESGGRRAAFLRNAAAILALKNVRILESRAEEVHERYDVVTFRAFRPLDAASHAMLERLVAPGGAIAAFKGRLDRIEEELDLAGVDRTRVRIVPIEVPFLREERHLVIIHSESAVNQQSWR